MIKKIVSGGQTGADQAGLDAAIKYGVPHGGWLPLGRLTENGPLPEKYLLQEMPSNNYARRTEQNVADSDGTLIIAHGPLTDGSALTESFTRKHGRPCLVLNMGQRTHADAVQTIIDWLSKNSIMILNIAGPRASKDPKIYDVVLNLLSALFRRLPR